MSETGGGPRFDRAEVNGQSLHYAAMGEADRPLMLFLHGFPEYWVAWAEVMPAFADRYFCVAPDQRGYNLSSKPEGVEAYRVKHLVADIAALARHLSPGRPVVLCAHDWGASVAYALAIAMPELVERLVIVNGTHPACFQDALVNRPEQARASQYFHLLRSPRAEEVLSRDDFALMFRLFGDFASGSGPDAAMRAGYLEAWRQPGALTGMLNWYRASPVYVPEGEETPDPDKAVPLDRERLKVAMPHLVVWGMQDTALLSLLLDELPRYAERLSVRRIGGAGHWVLHEKPRAVIDALGAFLDAP